MKGLSSMSEHLESLLTAVSPDAPSGVDLEYDPEFARMEKAAKGVPEQEMGSTRTEAVPPDWALVLDLTRKLLSRTHDLRTHRGDSATRRKERMNFDRSLPLKPSQQPRHGPSPHRRVAASRGQY